MRPPGTVSLLLLLAASPAWAGFASATVAPLTLGGNKEGGVIWVDFDVDGDLDLGLG